ncbi:Amidase 1 [Spatholobus suberectus]|nr:Amidase 1 [Spatholobus suberectus]
MGTSSNYGAFMKRFILQLNHSPDVPLNSLTFAVKDMYDVKGHVASFGNPDWVRTHSTATSIAQIVLDLLEAGATCVGTTIMDELAYSIRGENIHYGTPRNPCAADRVPGGSSSGSAVVVGAEFVDFSIGTDCLGSTRIPASYCGIFGVRPSHGIISKSGVIPMAQSFDTVGWFARDPTILNKVGRVLLQLPEATPVRPTKIIIAIDCFLLSSIPYDVLTKKAIKAIRKLYGVEVLKHEIIGSYVMAKVPELIHFMDDEDSISPLGALSNAMQYLERCEFKNNHGNWVREVKPNLGPGIKESVEKALNTTDEKVDICHSIIKKMRDALTDLLEDFGAVMIPTVAGPPPKLQTELSGLKDFSTKTFSLMSIAGVSGCCQVSMPLGMCCDLPISISFVAKHRADGFLLSLVKSIYDNIKEQEARA